MDPPTTVHFPMLGAIASWVLTIGAWTASVTVRPLERFALWTLRGFDTPRGAFLFFAAAALFIATLLALLTFAVGPGRAALFKISLGLAAYLFFLGYVRAYFFADAEQDAALAGLLKNGHGETIRVSDDVMERVTLTPRYAGILNAWGLLVFCIGLMVSFLAVLAGLLEGGFGPQAFRGDTQIAQPSLMEWAVVALWATLGPIDALGLLPRADQSLLGVRYAWDWAFAWILIFRLTLLLILLALVSAWFEARRKALIGLDYPGVWWEKEQYYRRLGAPGFQVLVAGLRDPSPARREDAARMLGALKLYSAEAARALTRALNDRSPAVRACAAGGLGALEAHGGVGVPGLIDRLNDPVDAVRQAAAKALGTAAPGAPNLLRDAVEALAAVVPEDSAEAAAMDWQTLVSVTQSLAEIGHGFDAAIAAVDRLRTHPDDLVRETGVIAYGVLRLGGARG